MESKKIYLLFTDTGTIFTRLIKLYTKKPYNHASISLNQYFTEVYSFGRKQPRNPFIGGFVKEDIRRGLFINARCAVYSLLVCNDQLHEMKLFIEDIESKKHLFKYNFLGLVSFLVYKPFQRDRAYFCSQFVAQVLREGGVLDTLKPLSLISPYDLQCLKNLELEFEGQLAELLEGSELNHSSFLSNGLFLKKHDLPPFKR